MRILHDQLPDRLRTATRPRTDAEVKSPQSQSLLSLLLFLSPTSTRQILLYLVLPLGVFSYSLLPSSLLGQSPPQGDCPHQGRDPNIVERAPESSDTRIDCNSGETISARGLTVSRVSAGSCPEWTTTGFRFNPIIPKADHYVSQLEEVHDRRRYYACKRTTGLWSWIVGSQSCEEISCDIIETQLTALLDQPCSPQSDSTP